MLMPTIILRRKVYDELVRQGKIPSVWVNDLAEKTLFPERKEEEKHG